MLWVLVSAVHGGGCNRVQFGSTGTFLENDFVLFIRM